MIGAGTGPNEGITNAGRRPIAGIYLAAGRSTRMGTHKLNLPFCGLTLGGAALSSALDSQLDHILVVVRREDSQDWLKPLQRHPRDSRWTLLHCDDANLGQAHSLRCGVAGARRLNAEGAMILLADQPLVPLELMNLLVERYIEKRPAFAAAAQEGQPQPPVLFSSSIFPDLLRLSGDQGARSLLRGSRLSGHLVEWADPAAFADVDTPEEYRRLMGRLDAQLSL